MVHSPIPDPEGVLRELGLYARIIEEVQVTPASDIELVIPPWSSGSKSPQVEDLKKFFDNPENIQRLVYIREMPVDITDGWGMFGNYPEGGFIFIEGYRDGIDPKAKPRTFNEATIVQKLAGQHISTPSGDKIPALASYWEFPALGPFRWSFILPNGNNPDVFEYLKDRFSTQQESPPTALSALAIEATYPEQGQ